MTDPFDRNVLFSRMIGLLTQEQLDSLANKAVGVGGAGGVGYTHAECLVRQGVGRIKISDFDTFGPENMSRQFGCTVNTIGREKAEVLEERLMSINPALKVDRFGALDESNVEEFVEELDLVCDGIEYFQVPARRLLHAEARRRRVPVMIVGPQAYGCTVQLFHPDHMSFDEYFDVNDSMSEQEQLDNWALGLLATKMYRHYTTESFMDVRNRTGSAVSGACLLSTAVMAGNALRLLLRQPMGIKPLPYIYHLDLVMVRFDEVHIPEGVRGIKADPKRYFR